jgi:hypothetical protein
MGTGVRDLSGGSVTLRSMLSLEPVTVRDIGSPQVFQTGETFRGAPLIDYQHPHDLVMGLGATYERPIGRVRLLFGADLVGSPALGPPVFMHRPSAAENPQAPLAHHSLDSTHITPGVLTAGASAGEWRVETSWFRGREPDENRLDVDLGSLDSTSVRIGWRRGAWSAQASGAALTMPEAMTPSDAKRLSASLAYTAPPGERGVSWLAAFGQNREIHGNLEAYLLEGTMRVAASSVLYARIESVAKDILDAGFHPPGVFHRHRQSQVGAFTAGYVRELAAAAFGSTAIGADITAYTVPDNLRDSYGSPLSFHIFLRYRPKQNGAGPVHVH